MNTVWWSERGARRSGRRPRIVDADRDGRETSFTFARDVAPLGSAEDPEVAEDPPQQHEDENSADEPAAELPRTETRSSSAQQLAHDSCLRSGRWQSTPRASCGRRTIRWFDVRRCGAAARLRRVGSGRGGGPISGGFATGTKSSRGPDAARAARCARRAASAAWPTTPRTWWTACSRGRPVGIAHGHPVVRDDAAAAHQRSARGSPRLVARGAWVDRPRGRPMVTRWVGTVSPVASRGRVRCGSAKST